MSMASTWCPMSTRRCFQVTDSHSQAPLRPPTQRIVEVRDAGHMGLGLFAKENIPRGARILAELPLFDMPAEQPLPNLVGEDLALYQELCLDNEYQDLEDFIKEVDLVGIDSQNIKTMETLYCNEEAARDEYNKHAIKNFIFRKIKIQWAIDCAKAGPYHRAPIPASRLERLRSPDPDRLARLWAIWNNNRVKLGQFATRDSGVFLLASRINHSCCPNAWYEFNPTTGRLYDQQAEMLTTHAIRDIKAGEQILVGYDAVSLKLRPERVEKLATWNVYNCICALCTNPVVEALQQRAYVLWQAADFWVRPRPSSQQQLVKQGIAPCKDAYEALKMGEEVIALLTHPIWNVRDSSSAEAYVPQKDHRIVTCSTHVWFGLTDE